MLSRGDYRSEGGKLKIEQRIDMNSGSQPTMKLGEKTSNESNLASIDSHRKCFPFRFGRVGNRQKIVILVWGTNVSYVVLIFTLSFSP